MFTKRSSSTLAYLSTQQAVLLLKELPDLNRTLLQNDPQHFLIPSLPKVITIELLSISYAPVVSRHAQNLEDSLLIPSLHKLTFTQLLPALASYDILIEASLIESHSLCTC